MADDENLPRPAARRDSIQNNPFIVADKKLKPLAPSASIKSSQDGYGKGTGFLQRSAGAPSDPSKKIPAEQPRSRPSPSRQHQETAMPMQSELVYQNRQDDVPSELVHFDDKPASEAPGKLEESSQASQ